MADYRFIIVDDHPLFRGRAEPGAQRRVRKRRRFWRQARSTRLTERLATASDTDLILLDLTMPGVHGVSGLIYLRAQHPEVPVVIVSASDDAETIRQLPRLRGVGLHPQVAARGAHSRRHPQGSSTASCGCRPTSI